MKVYYFPYGIGRIVAVPSSQTLTVAFAEVTINVAKSEVIEL